MRIFMAVVCFLLVIIGVGMAVREKTVKPVKEPVSERKETVKAPIIQERRYTRGMQVRVN